MSTDAATTLAPAAVDTAFLRLDAHAGWRAAITDALDLADAVRLDRTGVRAATPLDDPAGSFGGLVAPRGVVRDGDRLLAADSDRARIACWRIGSDEPAGWLPTLGPDQSADPSPRSLARPTGLALTRAGDLAIADPGRAVVLVLDLATLALRAVLRAPGGFDPVDVAAGSDGSLYVADRAGGRIHRFGPRRTYDAGFAGIGMPGAAVRLRGPERVVAGRDGRLYVADPALPFVTVLDTAGDFAQRYARPDELVRAPALLGVPPAVRLYVVDPRTDVVPAYDGSQADPVDTLPRPAQATDLRVGGDPPVLPGSRIIDLDPVRAEARLLDDGADRAATRELERIPGPEQLSDVLGPPPITDGADAIDDDGRLLVDGAPGPVVLPPLPAVTLEPRGWYATVALDSEIYRCPWHRFAVEAVVPDGASITVDTYTAELDRSTDEIAGLAPDAWSEGVANAADQLVLSDPGRFLWLRVTLLGNGALTPELDAIRVYAPRRSSLALLPAAYQQDETSRSFLDRLLSLFDAAFDEITTAIAGLGRYVDPFGTPDEWVAWLSSWLSLALDASWPLTRRRAVLADLPFLYARRGTVVGLRRLIRVLTDTPEPWPRVVEHYRLRRFAHPRGGGPAPAVPPGIASRFGAGDALDAGDPGAGAHVFSVMVPESAIADADQLASLDRVVAAWRPAHTVHSLCLVAPRMRVGVQATLGADAVVARREPPVLDRGAALGYLLDGLPYGGRRRTPEDRPRIAESTRLG